MAYGGSVVALTGFWWFVVVHGDLWCFMLIRGGSVVDLGGLWWFVVVYFVVACLSSKVHQNNQEVVYKCACKTHCQWRTHTVL